MERLANEVVDDVWAIVLRRVDVVDAELDRAAQDRAGTVGIAWRSEDARAGELHGAEADPAHGMGTQPCCRAQRHADRMRYVRGSDNTGTDGRRLSSAAPDGVGRGAPQAAFIADPCTEAR